MAVYVLLTRLAPEALQSPRSYETLERHVAEQIAAHCPTVQWLGSYALLGPWDYLDLIEAPDLDAAVRVSVLARSHGHAQTEVWPAMPWPAFKALLRELPTRQASRT